jgi:hypothetical protein
MDFNRLYSDHQVLLVKARRAATYGLRRSYEIAASDIAILIGFAQRSLGAAAARAWEAAGMSGKDAPVRQLGALAS